MQGCERAQYNLGVVCELGQGVDQNYRKAKEWYENAAAWGHEEAHIGINWILAKRRASPAVASAAAASAPGNERKEKEGEKEREENPVQ